jgi:microcystin-dependent protein
MSVPTGAVLQFGASISPAGFLVCDGASYAVGAYPALYAVIGNTYGGSGANFNVPNFQGRVPLGASGNYSLGSQGGSASITLTTDQLPAHTHGITDPGHTHNYTYRGVTSSFTTSGDAHWKDTSSQATSSSTTGITVNSAGLGQPYSNLNPYTAITYIIKT